MKSEYIDMFDDFYSGKLDEQEEAALEERLKTDTKMAQAFHEYHNLRNGIDYSIMKTLKEELQELEADLPEVKLEPEVKIMFDQAKTRERNRWWRAAAILVIVAASTAVLLLQQQPSSPQDLFSQHFEPYENTFVSAKRGDDLASDPVVQAFQNYDTKQYAEAIAGFKTVLADDSYQDQHAMVLFFLGSAQLSEGQAEMAIDTFERFLEISEDDVNTVRAKWYLALSFLQENQVENARPLLEDLMEDQHYGQASGKILKKLP